MMTLSCAPADEKSDTTQLSVRAAPGALPEADQRTAIEVDAETRAAVLTEMRTMLKGVQGIVIAAANRDTAGIRAAALKAGMKAASETDPVIQQQLGGDFAQLGMKTHAAFDILAADVAVGNQDVMLRRLATIMGNCVGCHEQWRLVVRQ
jgi:cytochrome c556